MLRCIRVRSRVLFVFDQLPEILDEKVHCQKDSQSQAPLPQLHGPGEGEKNKVPAAKGRDCEAYPGWPPEVWFQVPARASMPAPPPCLCFFPRNFLPFWEDLARLGSNGIFQNGFPFPFGHHYCFLQFAIVPGAQSGLDLAYFGDLPPNVRHFWHGIPVGMLLANPICQQGVPFSEGDLEGVGKVYGSRGIFVNQVSQDFGKLLGKFPSH